MAATAADLDQAIAIEARRGPPQQRLLPLSRLRFNPPYQRTIEAQRIRDMVATWDPNGLGVVYVSEKASDCYLLIDGQHRCQALRVVTPDDIDPLVPCLVYRGLTYEEEALLFELMNGHRKQPSVGQVFNAAVEGKDPDALGIVAALRTVGLGWTTGKASEGKVAAVGALKRIWATGGEPRLHEVLGILHDAYGNQHGAYTRFMLRGLDRFLERYRDEMSRTRLIDTLKHTDPTIISRRLQVYMGGRASLDEAAATGRILADLYNKGLRKSPLSEWESAEWRSRAKSHPRPGHGNSSWDGRRFADRYREVGPPPSL